ncbi:MAG: hypothetical protein AAGF27_04965 [Pseudomonadota bacterium]
MTNMENLDMQLSEKGRQQEAYNRAVRSIKAGALRRSAGGYAVMSAALGYGEGALGNGTFGMVSHYAKLFCIGFAMLVPSLLVWHVLL